MQIENTGKYKIGIDLGGTKTEAIVLNPTGDEVFRKRIPTPKSQGYNAILSGIASLVKEARNSLPGDHNWSIGMGIPGIIDAESGVVENANTTIMIGQPLQKDMEEILGHSIAIENDANCFTMAETAAGAAKDYSTVFGVIMGTGCGGGIAINGAVRHGPHGITGEWGHFSIDPAGPTCWCGNRGCVETLISGSGVENLHEARTGEKRSMQEIVQGYRNGIPAEKQTFENFLDDFGRALGGVISLLDPDAVVLGGGLSSIDELYTEGVRRVKHFTFHKNLRTPILRNHLGDSAGVIGAAWIGI